MLVCLLLPCSLASAQTEDLDSHIEQVREQFQQLNLRAEACLDDTETACQEFLSALDRELPRYLQHCEILRDWREQVVSDFTDADADAELAQRLIEVEFTCGEDALVKRNNAVLAAYQKTSLIAPGGLATLLADSANNQASQAFSRNQHAVSQDLSQQQQRLRNEIQQQWQRIQLQNVREENRQPQNFTSFPD